MVSPLANFLILPAIPAIMWDGVCGGNGGIYICAAREARRLLPYILLKIELFAVQWMANLPWASVEIKNFGWKYILVYYSILFLLVVHFEARQENEKMNHYN